MRRHTKNSILMTAALTLGLAAPSAATAGIALGDAGNYGILLNGDNAGKVTLKNSVQVNGDIGVDGNAGGSVTNTAKVNGNVDFSALNTGQFTTSGSGTVTGVVSYSVSGVGTALDAVNALRGDIADVISNNPVQGITLNVNNSNTQSVDITAGTLVDGTYYFNSTAGMSLKNSSTLTINGAAGQSVVFNLESDASISNTSSIVLTGGLTANDVLFNIVGGDLTVQSSKNLAGMFLVSAGDITLENSSVTGGRLFGGYDGHDITLKNSAILNAPPAPVNPEVPEPSSIALALIGFASLGVMGRKRATRAAGTIERD